MNKNFILSLQELNILCENLPKEGIILLRGDLGLGKTTLVKSLASSLNIQDEITSPTFCVLNCFEERFFHYDIYQHKTAGFLQRGLYENLSKNGLHVIEWGNEEFEQMLQKFGFSYICVDIMNSNEANKREYRVYECIN